MSSDTLSTTRVTEPSACGYPTARPSMCSSSGAGAEGIGSSWTMVSLPGRTGSAAVAAAVVTTAARRRRRGRALCPSSSRSALANKVSATPVMTTASAGQMTSWGSGRAFRSTFQRVDGWQIPPRYVRNRRPPGALPYWSMCLRSRVTSSGGIGTRHTAFFGPPLGFRASWTWPRTRQPAPPPPTLLAIAPCARPPPPRSRSEPSRWPGPRSAGWCRRRSRGG